ncbi:MAG: hypothetical protein H6733_13230 [Alphaproteobacteria bacterium]|nr:hypothetical protein [Alphaproteobacteria bacterium]
MALFVASCTGIRDDGPDPVDTPVVDTDTDVDTTPADSDDVPAVRIASVRIVPESPRWDDDLHCEVTTEHGDADVTIRWTVDDTPWRGAVVDGVRPKDTVPHLEQTGGQKWSCTAHLRLQEVEATKVRIEPPVPMVTVPAGSADMEFSTGTRGVYVSTLLTVLVSRPRPSDLAPAATLAA